MRLGKVQIAQRIMHLLRCAGRQRIADLPIIIEAPEVHTVVALAWLESHGKLTWARGRVMLGRSPWR